MTNRLLWDVDGQDWPHRASSRFVEAAGFRWHVQIMGEHGAGSKPCVLLVHGTGASTHSWRGLAPRLAEHFTVIAPDLPGHGFTDTPPSGGFTLPGMARALGELVRVLDVTPQLAVGHSAGAAVLLRLILDGGIAPRTVISLNGALRPFGGLLGSIASSLAKVLFLNPLAPRFFAWRAEDPQAVEALIAKTGSRLDSDGLVLYQRLFRTPVHCAAALGMMAHWDLAPLLRDLPRLRPKLVLVAGGNDNAITADVAFQIRDLVPGAMVEYLRDLGHLAHEERPNDIAALIFKALSSDVDAGFQKKS